MPTNAQAQRKYEEARRALNNIARSLRATEEQVAEARAARSRLSHEFIGENLADIEARTEQFRQFVRLIERAIRAIGRNSPIRALETLAGILDGAKALLEEPDA